MLSKAYYQALKEATAFHATHKTYSGSLALPHAKPIKDLIARIGATSVLDYGCGKGIQYLGEDSLEKLWGVPVTKYDPAWPPFAERPQGKFDLVICTHVLGCIPVVDLPEIVDDVISFASLAVYVGEVIGPTKKKVFSNPEAFPRNWSRDHWEQALKRPAGDVRMILATQLPEDGLRVRTKVLSR